MDFKEQVKSSVDIVKVIGEYVRLRRMGATGRYSGLCPFHQEKTPSFSVNQSRQFFKCFGCSVGGDVIKFVMDIEGMTFWETLNLLAERNGIPIPKRTEYSDAESKLRGALMDMHALAARTFQANLRSPQGGEAREYLVRRGLSDEMIEAFGLGYSDPGWDSLTKRFSAEGFSAELQESSGLVRRRQESSGHYDSFRGRLMFPIHNESGKVIAFGGRAMSSEEQAKYINSPETPIYRKSYVLYNLHRARDGMRHSNRVVLVEGYMDVIGVYAAGVKEVVASCGTALTATQVRALRRHADTVIVNFDPDTAGINASERAIQLLLDEGLRVRVLSLDGGLDPDEYAKQHGAEAYRAKLESANGYFHWLADRARVKFDMRTSEGRMDAFKFLLPSIQKISDRLERASIANDVAGYLGVETGLVLDQLKRSATERRAPVPQTPAQASISAIERILLTALLAGQDVREQILPRLSAQMTEAFQTREIVDVLRQMAPADGPVPFEALEGRLSPAAQSLLHQIIAADDTSDETQRLEHAHACLRRLEADRRKGQIDGLRARVKSAEGEGRLDEALRLMAELTKLERDNQKGEGL